MNVERLLPLHGDYPTLRQDVWTFRTAARDVVGDHNDGLESPDVLARIVSGDDPMVSPVMAREVALALRAAGRARRQETMPDA